MLANALKEAVFYTSAFAVSCVCGVVWHSGMDILYKVILLSYIFAAVGVGWVYACAVGHQKQKD